MNCDASSLPAGQRTQFVECACCNATCVQHDRFRRVIVPGTTWSDAVKLLVESKQLEIDDLRDDTQLET